MIFLKYSYKYSLKHPPKHKRTRSYYLKTLPVFRPLPLENNVELIRLMLVQITP